jgi:hypothetical protein
MKTLSLLSFLTASAISGCFAQVVTNAQYDVVAGNGNGIRFWQGDNWKIHMGNTSEYKYGAVTDYSIKMNMNNDPARGWTWGVSGLAPVAAINTQGNMQIAGNFNASTIAVGGVGVITSGGTDVYANIRVLRNTSTANTDGMYIGYGGSGGPLRFFSNSGTTEFVTITTSGNTGIGTTTPDAKLTISQIGNGWNDGLRINRDALNYLTLTEDVTDIRLKNWGAGGIRFFTSTAQAFTILNSGNVGIGNEAPVYKLDVNGPINATALNINGQPLNTTQWTTAGTTISYTGKVGIGTPLTSNPNNYSLAVKGSIGANEVKVENNSTTWPDYVFDEKYELPSLGKMEAYIQEHKHLEGVPSAVEVKANGYSLDKMDEVLLKKVEELSLYIIQQQKEIDALKKRLDEK